MKTGTKIKNAEILAKRFGVFVSVDDHKLDIKNAKAAIEYRKEMQKAAEIAKLQKTMADFVEENPEKAEFFIGKKGHEVCRVKTSYKGKEYEWCGLIRDMKRTSPFWIQSNEYLGA